MSQYAEEFGDFMRVRLATAPRDTFGCVSGRGAREISRALVAIARRLADLDALREGVDVKRRRRTL